MARAALQIHILGRLKVVRNHKTLNLGGPKQRRVLAVLLSSQRQPISPANLIDGVWGSTAPRTARKTLHGYVHHLRAEFGEALQTVDHGYILDLSDDDVDAWKFDRLAESILTQNDAESFALADRCSEALGLWSGLPYEGFEDSEVLEPEIVRLSELRLEIVAVRLKARLAVGEAASTIAELESLTRQHPFREQFRLLHMTALYRSGRQAEALRAFDQTRTALIEELGLEPGPQLQELRQQILEQAAVITPELVIVGGSGPPPTRSSQANLPPDLDLQGTGLRGYEVRETLLRSTSRAVYRAFHASLGREVLIRATIGDAANNSYLIENFQDELLRLSQITQPTGVLLVDAWREPGALYQVEPWHDGGSLRSRRTDGPFTIDETLRVLQQIAMPLTQAHNLGFCHGNLRPSAVRFDVNGHAHLGDFNIAGLSTDRQAEEQFHYTAPEVRRGDAPTGPPSDVFALGQITAFLLDISLVQRHELGQHKALRTVLLTASDPNPENRPVSVERLVRSISRALTATNTLVTAPDKTIANLTPSHTSTIRNPYKGLRAFQQSDSGDFFGRDRLIQHLIASVQRSRFVAIVGPSGVGKSSLVKAGLIPALRARTDFCNPEILVTEMFPGRYPFEELLSALKTIAVAPPTNGLGSLISGTYGLHTIVEEILPNDGRQLLLIIDQFEELFSLVTDDEERKRFIATLVAAVNHDHSRLRVVVTLRADYYDRPLEFRDLGQLLESSTIPVRAPDLAELRQAIERPAAASGLELDPGLADQIVQDVSEQPGGLPLMQYALAELVDTRTTTQLSLAAYYEMDGVLGAVAARAEEIWQDLAEPGQRAIRQVFLRLVTIDDSATGMRRRALRSELNGLSISQTELAKTLNVYGEHRLLSFDRDPVTRGPTVEVAHEALLERWPRLKRWIQEEREHLVLRRRLLSAMAEWTNSGHDQSYVLRGSRLAQYETWSSGPDLMLTKPERHFLRIGQELRAEEADAERRTNRRLRAMLTGAVLFALLAVVAGAIALVQAERASRQAEAAEANRLEAEVGRLALRAPQLIESDRQVALLLSVEAVRRAPDPVSFGALQEVLANTQGFQKFLAAGQEFDSVAFTASGDVVGVSRDTLTLFRHEANWDPLSWPLTGSTAVAIDPSLDRLAIADAHGVRFLELPSVGAQDTGTMGEPLFRSGPDHVTTLEYNTTGTMLAIGDAGGVLTIVDLRSGDTRSWTPHPETETTGFEVPAHQPDQARLGIRALAFSPDGSRIATGGLVFARIWDIESEALVSQVWLRRSTKNGDQNAAVRSIRFDPTGNRIDVASSFGVRRHESETGALISEILVEGRATAIGPASTDSSVSLDAQSLGLSLRSGEVILTYFDGRPTIRFDAQVSGETSIARSRDGRLIAIGSAEGIVLWSTTGHGLIQHTIERFESSDVSFNIAGDRMASASAQNLPLRYFEVSTGQATELELPAEPVAQFGWAGEEPGLLFWNFDTNRTFLVSEDLSEVQPISSNAPIAVGRHRHLIALGLGPPSSEHTIQIVTDTGAFVAQLDGLDEFTVGGQVTMISFSPDGLRMVANTEDGAAAVWDTQTWELSSILSHGAGQIVVSRFTPDGKYFLTMSSDGAILLRDPWTFKQDGAPLVGQVDGLSGISYGPRFTEDGRYMFTSADGRLRIWDLDARLQIGSGFPTESGTAASSSGSSKLGATVVGEKIHLWNLDVDSWTEIACDAVGRNLTIEEWQQFGATDDPYPTTCSQWPADPRSGQVPLD